MRRRTHHRVPWRRLQGATAIHSRRVGRGAALLAVIGIMLLHGLVGMPAAAQSFLPDCKQPPSVVHPGSGLVGTLDPPLASVGIRHTPYGDYSYAGTEWNTYDLHTGPSCSDPPAQVDNWTASKLFNVAKVVVAATNGVHYMQLDGGLLGQFDTLINVGTAALYHGATLPYLALALLIVSIAVLWQTHRGDLAATGRQVGRVAAGLWLLSATFLTPLVYVHLLDGTLLVNINQVQANVLAQVPGNSGGLAGGSFNGMPNLLYDQVVYRTWLKGEFGSADSSEAKTLGPRLQDAQACSKAEELTDSCDATKKQQEFTNVADQIQQMGNYDTFRGIAADRTGTAFQALIEAFCDALFQLMCELAVLFAEIVLRLVVLCGPVLGLLAFAPGVMRTIFRAVAGTMAQGLILMVAATVHAFVLAFVVNTGTVEPGQQIYFMVAFTVIVWMVAQPYRRIHNMVSMIVGLPPLSRDQRRLEHLLRRRHRRGRGGGLYGALNWLLAPDWVAGQTKGPGDGGAPGSGAGSPNGPQGPQGPRPETSWGTIHFAEVVEPGTTMAAGAGRPSAGRDYIDGQAWEHEDPSQHARGQSARTVLAPGSGPRRAETGPAGHTTTSGERPAPGTDVVPSRGERSSPWVDGQRADSAPPVPPRDDHGRRAYRIYRPSTDSTHSSDSTDSNTPPRALPRPENRPEIEGGNP